MINYFRYFAVIYPWKRAWSFIRRNLNSLHPRMVCAMLIGWNWPFGTGEEICLLYRYYIYLLLDKGLTLRLCKLRQTLDTYRFWRRWFLNFVIVFSLFLYYPFLERSVALHLHKIESTSPKTQCQVCLKLAEWNENLKSLQTNWGQTDDRQAERLAWAFSPGELIL